MASLHNNDDLLKSIVQLSNSSLPLQAKLDRMLQSISEAFQPDRCLLLEPERIDEDGFLSGVASQKKPLSSLGLGLPIVHKIITSHRGQIEVDNHPGRGVKFIIVLPSSGKGEGNRIKCF